MATPADRHGTFIVQPPLLPNDPGPADLPPADPFDLTIFALRQELSTALGLKVGRIPGLPGYTRRIADRVLDRLQHRPYENFAGLADGLGEWQSTFLVLRALVLTGEVVTRHYGPCLWYLRPDRAHQVPWYLSQEHYPAAADDPEQGDPFDLALDAVGSELGCAIRLGVPRFVGPPAQHVARQALALLTPSQEYTLVALMEALPSSLLTAYLVLQALVIRGDLRVAQQGAALVYGRDEYSTGARSTEAA